MKQEKLDIARLFALAEILRHTEFRDWVGSVRSAAEKLRDAEEPTALDPDMWWIDDPCVDPEYSAIEGPDDAFDGAPYDAVQKLSCAKSLPARWVAFRCLTVDDNGDADETETAVFTSEADALKCWPESFATARAALAAHPIPGEMK